MDFSSSTRKWVVAFSVALFANTAQADGLSDLKQALSKLKGTTPVAARITNQIERFRGSGDDLDVKKGLVTITAFDDENGLVIRYDADTLQRIDTEARAKAEDETAPTPTIMGLDNNLNTMDMRMKFSAVAHLEKRLTQARFEFEEEIEYQGRTLRMLHFYLPINAIISDKTTRKYVDSFEAGYSIIIDEQGNPVESELLFNGRGRAYIVLSVRAEVSSKTTYQVFGERLLQMTNEYKGRFESSLWPDSEYSGGHQLEIIDPNDF